MADTNTQNSLSSKDVSSAVFGLSQEPITRPEQIVSVTWDNLKLIKPEWLSNEDLLYELKLFVLDTSESNDVTDIGNLLKQLHGLLVQAPKLAEENPITFREYLRMLVVLKGSMLVSLTDVELQEFIKGNVMLALEVSDFDLSERIAEVFLLARGFPVRIQDLREKLLHALEENLEVLGTSPLDVPGVGENSSPTVRNWIKNYNQFASASSVIPSTPSKRGALERAAYVAKNDNVRTLTEDQKGILVRLLELYDWLRFENLTTTPAPAPIPPPPQSFQIPPSKVIEFGPGPAPASRLEPEVVLGGHGQDLDALKKEIADRSTKPVTPSPVAPAKPMQPVIKPAPAKPQPPPVPVKPQPAPVPRIEPKAPTIQLTPAEIKRELNTPELPKPATPIVKPFTPAKPIPTTPVAPPAASRTSSELEALWATSAPKLIKPVHSVQPAPTISLQEIKTIDGLKKVSVANLRQAPIKTQLQLIKSKVVSLAAANKALPYYAVIAFEASPLFKSYLEIGAAMMEDSNPDRRAAFSQAVQKTGNELTLQEFEAIADLRKDIERL
jgi:hypothetical protein